MKLWAWAGMAPLLMYAGLASAETSPPCAGEVDAEFTMIKGVLPPSPQRQAPPLEPTVETRDDNEGGPPPVEEEQESRAETGTAEARRRTRPIQPRGRREGERRRSLPDSVLIERPPSL